MRHRRGFKTEANGYARDMRLELGLEPHNPLCPWRLADHLGYPVKKLSDFANTKREDVAYLRSDRGKREFSAITLFSDGVRWIVHNDAHHPYRQAANLAHELAHGLLLHVPAPLRGANGGRTFDPEQENEASWLGPALLISDEAAIFIVENRQPHSQVCKTYADCVETLVPSGRDKFAQH